uniref:Tox high mobility group box family member 3-like protein isoform x2 n=1 Tax=Triatoma infestans TaxID=30076 RepID=A0A170Y636_TRIIF
MLRFAQSFLLIFHRFIFIMINTQGQSMTIETDAVMMGHMGQQQQQQPPQQQQQHMQPPQQQSPSQVNPNNSYMQQQQAGGGGPSGEQPMSGDTPSSSHPQSNNHCIRSGCPNPAVVNSEWEDEYCSNECVVTHCRDVFSSWVASNQNAAVK